MKRIHEARIRLRGDDAGIAMVMVIGISMVLMILVTVGVGVSLSGVVKSKTDESWNAAIAAAYAGVEDYKSKLANDNSYYQYGNTAAPFSAGSTLNPVSIANPAFGTGVSGTWAEIPDDDDENTPTSFYRYEVDTRDYLDTGILKVRATGRVGDVTRSVVANLKQKGFIDFLYYTTFEIGDPALLEGKTDVEKLACEKYAYQSRPSYCGAIAFGPNDTINGPMHSNDSFRACGSTFNGAVTTAYKVASGDPYLRMNGSGTACPSTSVEKFPKGRPQTTGTTDLPLTNKKMFNEVRTDIPAETPKPGCLYTGPTKITFTDDGFMTVRSPWTKVTRVTGNPATVGTAVAECGLAGTANGQLGSTNGARVKVPERNLIYVQDVQFTPSNVTSTNIAWKTGTYPSKPTGGAFTNTDCNAGNFVGYPIATENVRLGIAAEYNCKKGDVFVEGVLDGEVTINAENYAYVTGDIRYDTTSPDSVLGLVAQNQVWVWNPVKAYVCTNTRNGTCTEGNWPLLRTGGRTIDAAMLSVNRTFQVQNYDSNNVRGQLKVTGAIAQKFRGPVGLGNATTGETVSGFTKLYNYDDRFYYIAPPKFLSPVSTTYEVNTLVEVKTAYNSDGSPIT